MERESGRTGEWEREKDSLQLSLSIFNGASRIFSLIEPHHQTTAEVIFHIDAGQIEERVALRLCDSRHGLQVGADAECAVLQQPHPTLLFEYLRARFTPHFIGIVFPRQFFGL